MNPHLQTLIIDELHRLEAANYMGLLGTKYLSPDLTASDSDGQRVTFININPAGGWAIVAFGKPDEEVKYKFLRDIGERWHYDGVEKMEAVH
jgi:hypothetical protein